MRVLFPPLLLSLAACSSADFGRKFEDGDFANDTDAAPSADGDDGLGADPGSETEDDLLSLKPEQTDVFVFIANPDRGTVTRVDVQSLDVITREVGLRPTIVRVTDDYATAVVFNQGDATVSVLDADTLDETVVPVRDNLNAMALSPDGRWAMLWHAVAARTPEDPPLTGVASFNEVSVVNLETASHTPLVVGFTPKDIAFTPDASLALAVSDASMAVLRLEGDIPTPEFIPVADPLDPPVAEEVVVSPDGAWAFLRQRSVDALTLVDLDTRAVFEVPVGSDPTDLDLDATGARAIVVSRVAREVAAFDVSDPLSPPEVLGLPGEDLLGSVVIGPDDRAVLYTNAAPVERYATWDINTGDLDLYRLAKPVRSLAVTPTGTSMLIVHQRTDNPDGSTPEPYRNAEALSLVDLADHRANTLRLAGKPSSFANATNGRQGYVILEDTPALAVLDYASLLYQEIGLRSIPRYLGVLPDLDPADDDEPRAWVSQDHPLGRLTLFDPDDSLVETLTGFELNGRIED